MIVTFRQFVTAAALCAAMPLSAQGPLPPGVIPPAPGGQDKPGEPNEPLPNPVLRNAADANRNRELDFPNLNGEGIANLYYELTGKQLLVSQQAAQVEIAIVMPGKLTTEEAAIVVEKRLAMEGFQLEPDPDLPNVMVLQLAAEPSKRGGVISSLEDLDGQAADKVVTYVMGFEYLKPDEALRAFQGVVQQFGTGGTVTAVPNAGSVVLRGNVPLVRLLVELKEKIDVPSAQVGTRFVEVTYADVEDLADKLNDIFNQQQSNQQSARVQRTNVPPLPGANNAGAAANTAGGGGAGEETPVHIIANQRTNSIFLMGRPVDLIFVESLIRDFDAPSSRRNFLRHKLRYLPVTEFLDVAANALERTLETSAQGGARRSSAPSRTTSTRNTSTQNRTSNTGIGNTAGNTTGSRAQVGQQDLQTAPESMLIGKTLLVADNISNSVVVNGPPHHIEIIQELIAELDQPSEQVAITAVFARYTLNEGRNFGLDLAHLLDGVGGNNSFAGQLRTGVPSVLDPNTLTDFTTLLGAAGATSGFSGYGLISKDFGVFVNALETNSNFTSISRPTIFTTNNATGTIASGQRIAVPTSTFQGNTTGFSTNVEFRDIELELEVTPLVNSSDEVTLDIALVQDTVGNDRVISGFGSVPDINTESLNTIVTVPNQATIILGGLITEQDTKNKTGIPILSSIPIVGSLVGSNDRNKIRSELVILIHPTIIKNHSQLDSYQQHYDTGSKISPKARESVQSGVLPPRGQFVPQIGKGIPVEEYEASQPAAGQTERAADSSGSPRIVTSPAHLRRSERSKRRR